MVKNPLRINDLSHEGKNRPKNALRIKESISEMVFMHSYMDTLNRRVDLIDYSQVEQESTVMKEIENTGITIYG